MEARTIVRGLVLPAGPETKHLLTLQSTRQRWSTELALGEGGEPQVEHPEVIDVMIELLASGELAGVVLRTFEHDTAFTTDKGVPIPAKTVRGWRISTGNLLPMSEAEIFSAYCTDAETGEAIPPERGVTYAGAWAVSEH